MADPGQVSNVGTTSPTPFPERVGAKHNTCSGPLCRRYQSENRPSTTPSGPTSRADLISFFVAQHAEPYVVMRFASRPRKTDIAIAIPMAAKPPEDAITAPCMKIV